MLSERTLEDILIDEGLVQPSEIHSLLDSRLTTDESIIDVLARTNRITDFQRIKCLGLATGIPVCDIKNIELDPGLVKMIPKRLATRRLCVVLDATDSAATVAMANPLDLSAIDELSKELDLDVDPMWAVEADLLEILANVHGGTSDVQEIILEASRDLEASGIELNKGEQEEEAVNLVELREVAEGGPVVQLANALFAQAIKYRASDIHVEPSKGNVRVRFRIDGVLKEIMEFPREVHRAVVSRVKIVSGLDIAERRVPQDGRCSLVTAEGEFDFRVATYPSVNGEKICIRVLDKRKSNQDVELLGIHPTVVQQIKQCAESSQGLILVNGPTGSGKTTTLYSLLNYLNNSQRHIITVEDPVEYQLDGIIQGNVNKAAGMTFATGLRAMLRQDPDVILVGESRDPETAKTAIEAALTGHMVLTSLHANDSAAAVTRLLEMGIEDFLLSASLTCSMAQRLVRTICPKCTATYKPDPTLISRLKLDPDREYVHGAGCDFCAGTGYKGRMGVYELLIADNEVRQMISDHKTSTEIMQRMIARGMRTMLDDAKDKLLQGKTTVEEVLRVVAVEVE